MTDMTTLIPAFDALAQAGYDLAQRGTVSFDELIGGISMLHWGFDPCLIIGTAPDHSFKCYRQAEILDAYGVTVVALHNLAPYAGNPADIERWIDTVQTPTRWPRQIDRSSCKYGV